jgi:hypothetical protein
MKASMSKWTVSGMIVALTTVGTAAAQGGEAVREDLETKVARSAESRKATSNFKRPLIRLCRENANELCQAELATRQDKAVVKCLANHRENVSPGCLGALRKARKVASFRKACGADVKQLCADSKTNGRQIAGCLRKNEAQVSQPCKARLAKGKGKGKGKGKEGEQEVAAVAGEAVVEEEAGAEPIDQELQGVPEVSEEEAPVEEAPPETTPTP